MTHPWKIDKNWTLFLDRDGVINDEKHLDYIYSWDEFSFYEGVKEALQIANEYFGPIVMVTNQRGIGKGLMTEKDLHTIHAEMMTEIATAGGRIDKIYYCPAVDNEHPDRKPNPGMAFKAQKDNPLIHFDQSVIVGNNLSDMRFARNAGMHSVLLTTTSSGVSLPHPLVDDQYSSLIDFMRAITKS
ncbi:MAG TPA: HAD-IIIA family hydrolase [Flavitalea sp.]|nr:HAD-IIIA family hydrolase [Flavitalea sp.]